MNKRQIKKAFNLRIKWCRQLAEKRAKQRVTDIRKFDIYASTPNGSARLVAFHDAVSDADDTLEAVDRAIADEHYDEARRLIALGRESIKDRITELKDLL